MNIRDRAITRIQSVIQWSVMRGHIVAWLALIVTLPLVVYAATNELNTFVPNTTISSSKVNKNFVMLDERIGVYEDAISVDGNNIGIGVTKPGAPLSIAGDAKGFGINALSLDYNSGATRIAAGSAGGDSSLSFITYKSGVGVERMRVMNNGDVGIGTASPSTALQINRNYNGSFASLLKVRNTGINQSATAISIGNEAAENAMTLEVYNADHLTRPNYAYVNSNGGGPLIFGTKGGERMRVTPDGKVGVGTTSPTNGVLQVHSSTETAPIAAVNTLASNYTDVGYYGTGRTWFAGVGNGAETTYGVPNKFFIFDAGVGAVRMTVDTSGLVGIGTTTPTQKLHVVGKVTADDYLYNSDSRLKRDITPLENAAEGIHCLQGVSYRWEDPSASQDLQIGLIAQDVEACYPEVVTTDSRGFKSVSYARLVAPLIEVVKGQQDTITALENRDSERQKQFATLEARLARLESHMSERK